MRRNLMVEGNAKKEIDELLGMLAFVVYVQPVETTTHHLEEYLSRKAEEVFSRFKNANDIERTLLAINVIEEMAEARGRENDK